MGGGEVRKPLQIPWPEMFGDHDGPVAEVIVPHPTSPGAREVEDGYTGENLSDHDLREAISRCRSNISNAVLASKLPDKGAKFQTRLRQLEAELDKREKVARWSERVGTQSQTAVSPGLRNHQPTSSSSHDHPNVQSSFTSLFDKKLNDKEKHSSRTAFNEEIGSINRRNKRSRLGWNSRMSLRSSSFRCSSSIGKGAKQRSSDGESRHNASHYAKCFTNLFSKGSNTAHCCGGSSLKSSGACMDEENLWEMCADKENDQGAAREPPVWSLCSPSNCGGGSGKSFRDHAASHQDSTEVQEVVLLDEEDAQPIQQKQVVSDELKEAKIYYPSRDHPECVEICFLDLKCLDPGSYLSSTIMNFYIQYLQKPAYIVGRPRGEYHFFNTYFYKKLEEAVSSKVERNACFTKLRRWLKGVNIFQKSYLLLPIHGNLHWSLVIICIPAIEEESGPVILHLDSLGLHDSKMIFENIERYLKEEWNHICQNSSLRDFPIPERIWSKLPCRIVNKKIMVPQQKNEYDCGLFVLYFMERFIEEAPERVRMKDLDMFGKKWFRSEEASELRKRLRELLIKEFESARLEDNVGSPASFVSTYSASSLIDGICPIDIS